MDSVKCPICSVYTINIPIVVEGLVYPSGNLNNPIHGSYPVVGGHISVVQCGACKQIFVVDRGRAVWPLDSPQAPKSVPEKIREAYEDARRAHAAGANIGALMAARTTLIRFLRDKQAENFKELVEKQVITPAIYGGVDQLRLWASVAGHDDIEVDEFDAQEIEDILDYLGTALESAYTHQARVDQYVRRTNELRSRSDSTSPS